MILRLILLFSISVLVHSIKPHYPTDCKGWCNDDSDCLFWDKCYNAWVNNGIRSISFFVDTDKTLFVTSKWMILFTFLKRLLSLLLPYLMVHTSKILRLVVSSSISYQWSTESHLLPDSKRQSKGNIDFTFPLL